MLAAGADARLAGLVSDDADDPADLAFRWESDVAGVIGEGAVLADGTAEANWPADGRASGTHQLTLTATDSCGNETSATVTVSRTAP